MIGSMGQQARLDRLIDLLAAGRRIVLRGRSGINLGRGISFLREAVSLADALGEDDAYIEAVSNLTTLLMAKGRVSTARAEEAIRLMSDAVERARNLNKPSLGLLLTSLAETRVRTSRTKRSLSLAHAELREALPLRQTAVDKAYTLNTLARVLYFIPEEDPNRRFANWQTAVVHFTEATKTFRNNGEEIAAFERSVVNMAEVVADMLWLSRMLNAAESFDGDTGPRGPRPANTGVGVTMRMADLARIDASVLYDSDITDSLAEVATNPVDQTTISTTHETMLLLARIQDSAPRANPELWSSAQYWLATLDERLIGTATHETARRREAGLENCPVENDPEEWCRWATEAMNSFSGLGDYSKASALGRRAVDAYLLAMQNVPDPSDQVALTLRFHYLGRRAAFFALSVGDTMQALAILNRIRGRSRFPIDAEVAPIDPFAVSRTCKATLVYLVAGPESTFIVAVDQNSRWKVEVLHIDSLGGKQLIQLVMGTSSRYPGLLMAQGSNQQVLQVSLDNLFEALAPFTQRLHEWLTRLEVNDILLSLTGPYSLLPLVSAPVEVSGKLIPFNWLHRCSLLPSAVFGRIEASSRVVSRSILLAADAIRPDLERLRTRTEGEGIRHLSESSGWSARLLLGKHVNRELLLQGTSSVGIIHFAGHAKTDPFDPETTVLCLTDGDLSLTSFLELLTSPPQMFVLSACQTGQSSLQQAPDENVGFVAAALDKGVAIVVGSLWPVADRDTTRFMKAFYTALFRKIEEQGDLTGFIVHDALVEAQRAGGEPNYANSRHWAAFQVFGI